MKDRQKPSAREQAFAAFKQVTKAASRADRAEADRWLKTAERMTQAAERLDALPEPENEAEKAEEIRAELRARIARFCQASVDNNEWERQRGCRDAVAAFAREHGLPEPPEVGPEPYSEHQLELIGAGRYYPLPRTNPPLEPEELEARRRRESSTGGDLIQVSDAANPP